MTLVTDDEALPVVRAADLDDGDTLPRWLVDTLWAHGAVGVLGGAPKCCKSWLALDLAVSVATGTPCLGAFDVDDPGPVLLYMAEDAAPVVKARLAGICRARAIDLASVPIHVITIPVLRLDRGRDQARLRAAVRQLSPHLLVLDPFVRLHRIDENDAGEVSALLGYLRTLQRQHDVAVLVVHHARKNAGTGPQAGLSLRGSGDFHAWGYVQLHITPLMWSRSLCGARAQVGGIMVVGAGVLHITIGSLDVDGRRAGRHGGPHAEHHRSHRDGSATSSRDAARSLPRRVSLPPP